MATLARDQTQWGKIEKEFVTELGRQGHGRVKNEVLESVRRSLRTEEGIASIQPAENRDAVLPLELKKASRVAVPVGVFTALTSVLVEGAVPSKRLTFDLRTCLTTLLNYNLLKGSLAQGSGVFMHDIVRDYKIAQLD